VAAIASQDTARVVKVPGIGKKTAERLLLELRGKLGDSMVAGSVVRTDHQGDILQALVALGYSEKDAGAALKNMPVDIGVSEGIKLALRALAN
jgi:Holliday junction DNA helicase RuvA